MITSAQNEKIKWVRALQARGRSRRQAQAFVVEGVRLAEEALQAGWGARLVLHTPDLSPRGQAVVDGFAAHGAPVEAVSQSVLQAASDTQSPQGILVVLSLREIPMPERPDFIFIPDAMRDPGNLGAMLRSAAAAGVDAVLLPPGTADPLAPKVVRAAMGAHFLLPVRALEWEQIHEIIRTCSLHVYLAAAGGGLAYTQVDLRRPLALIVGGEAEGASPQAAALAQEAIHIPMPGGMESLNAAAAAAVLLFEVVRQRAITPAG